MKPLGGARMSHMRRSDCFNAWIDLILGCGTAVNRSLDTPAHTAASSPSRFFALIAVVQEGATTLGIVSRHTRMNLYRLV